MNVTKLQSAVETLIFMDDPKKLVAKEFTDGFFASHRHLVAKGLFLGETIEEAEEFCSTHGNSLELAWLYGNGHKQGLVKTGWTL